MELILVTCGFTGCSKKTNLTVGPNGVGITYPRNWVVKLRIGNVALIRCPRHKNNSCDEEGSH